MASTLTKNATKPNPSKILQLQTAKEEDQLDDLKNVGESSYNPGDGTDQRVQSLVFMIMMNQGKNLCSHYTLSASLTQPLDEGLTSSER